VLADSAPLSVAGVRVAAMSPTDLLLSLCVHGAKHGWLRLFWLADIDALLHHPSTPDGARLLARARELGVDRMFLQAMLLAHRLYGSPVGPGVLAVAGSDRQAGRLVDVASSAIEAPPDRWRGARSLHGILVMQRYVGGLRRGWRYRWRVLVGSFVRPTDWGRVRLPDGLFFLYWPLRPLLRWWPRGRGVK